MKRIAIAILAAALTAGAQPGTEAEQMLKAAKNAEMVDGNLNAAIRQYEAIVAKFSKTNHAAAARALLRMAECQQKLGEAESRKTYERVVREFKDQEESVDLAQARLGAAAPASMTNRLVFRPGYSISDEGTVSVDGRYVSFVDWRTGNLAIRDLRNGSDRRITDFKHNGGPLKVFAEESAISRDSKQVAFNRFDKNSNSGYELWVANLIGEPNPRRMYANPDVDWMEPRDWSPDGKSIVVLIALKDKKTNKLGLVSVADGSLRVLQTGSWRGNTRIFFSPDGKYIAYDLPEKNTERSRDIFVMALNNAKEVPAVQGRGIDLFMGWSPDGRHLLFASERTGSMGLWRLGISNGEVYGEPQPIKGDVGNINSLGVTDSGALYYWQQVLSGSFSNVHVATLDLAAGRLIDTPQAVTDELESNYGQVWSPDGKSLAYISNEPNSAKQRLVVRSADSGRIIREVRLQLRDFWPHKWVGGVLYGEGWVGTIGNTAISVNIETGAAEPILGREQLASGGGPRFSQEGKSVFFRQELAGAKEITLIQQDIATGQRREIFRREWFTGIGISPDSQYIVTAGIDRASNSRTVLLISVATGQAREVLRVPSEIGASDLTLWTNGTRFWHAEWVADGESFLILKRFADETQSDEVWEVPLRGTPRKLDFRLPRTVSTYRLQPHGKKIAWGLASRAVRAATSELWVLENFLPTEAK